MRIAIANTRSQQYLAVQLSRVKRKENCKGPGTLTLDHVTRQAAMYHSPTSTCVPNFTEIRQTFLCMDERMHGQMDETGQ